MSRPTPQTPLPPDRLAKIANALGVATPVPASSSRAPPSTSSYLVHVVPPLSLPHLNTSLAAAPPPSASGYHTHFRRGTLLPVYPTMQLQLAAIAREFALPSSAGLLLYLVESNEPGPRISDDIWKHLWSRVWKAEFAPDAADRLPALKFRLNSPLPTEPLPRPASAADTRDPDKSLVPIVAKIEFDIDSRAAVWFNPWMVSRNINYAKRNNTGTPITLNLPRTPSSLHVSSLEDEESLDLRPTMNRKNIPPRLMLGTSQIGVQLDNSTLAYLQQPDSSSDEETEIEDESTSKDGKRGGGVYDDLVLGLDQSFAESEESQYLLTAKLDQIEKDLAQFSPRVMHVDLAAEIDQNPPPLHTDLPSPSPSNASWPAIPFTSINSPLPGAADSTPSFAVNGVSISAPKSFAPALSGAPSAETIQRRKEQEEEWGQYPNLTPKLQKAGSPVIPLSPDPFGRYSSTPPPGDGRGSTYWEDGSTVVGDEATTSSRFSADSLADVPAPSDNKALKSVKSIKKLWHRSSKQSISLAPQPPMPEVPGHRSNGSTSGKRTSSQQGRSSTSSGKPSRPSTRPPSLELPPHDPMPVTSSMSSNFQQMRFDGESPYPNPTKRARTPATAIPIQTNGRASSPTPSSPGRTSPVPQLVADPKTGERISMRKSLMKWASGGGGNSGRPRSGSKLSVNSAGERPSLDKAPPSPRIPEQFLQQQQQQGHVPTMSQSSIAPSMMSRSKSASSVGSRYSEDEGRGPSIDEQFEIVSPKLAPGSLSYPYTTVDKSDEA
ncbi:hypothetical protein CYLTODRAFT_442703 [Cylindrobasidium torrendii FP15055 ss-10]|uniref:Uncharacterized protein n=1 Tax=Cylindrobasidium torrendii FP15055 ss-10 TaxID=1314674 RepID=A0A0D7BI76_9AGAR|nr:hypothetical protein CYLTODRAFT_442703 [Cylindrobasidium torrendii FP15055 ss-10]